MMLAAFYSEVTGLPVTAGSHDNWAGIQLDEIELAFTPVEDYRAPQWPDGDHPKQFHLDFEVDDIEAEHAVSWPWARPCTRTPSAPTASAGASTPTPSVTRSASAATRASRGPTRAPSGR